MVQAILRDDPWKLLVACSTLNRTSWRQAYPALETIFDRWPGPGDLAGADPAELEEVLRPLGLFRRRTVTLRRLSAACADLPAWPAALWPGDLPGVGRYASDAYRIFVGRDGSVEPEDARLRGYLENFLTDGTPRRAPSDTVEV